ncbi:unnamed protein product, partial [marine sediment metagenome]
SATNNTNAMVEMIKILPRARRAINPKRKPQTMAIIPAKGAVINGEIFQNTNIIPEK